MVETELAADTVSSGELLDLIMIHKAISRHVWPVSERMRMTVMCCADLQKPSAAEELRASTVTHLSLRIEDTSDDDIIFVKEWRVSATEAKEPSSKE